VVSLSAVYAVIAAFMIVAFPIHLRYSGISIAYQFCCAVAGGTTPLIGTLIAGNFKGEWLPLALYFSLLAGVSFACIWGLAHYQHRRSLTPNVPTGRSYELGQHI